MTTVSIDTMCLLVSVEIISHCRILKQWSLHQVSDTGTLDEDYCSITTVSGSAFQSPLNCKTTFGALSGTATRVGLPGLSGESYSQKGYRVWWKVHQVPGENCCTKYCYSTSLVNKKVINFLSFFWRWSMTGQP